MFPQKMKRFLLLKIFIVLSLVGAGSAVIFISGFHYGFNQIPAPPEDLPATADLSLLWDVWRKLEEKYSGPLDYQKMIYGAAKGLVGGLGDPYTVFFPPQDSKIFRDDISGSFEGVGMEIGKKKGELTVVAPLVGTPAQKAGLLPGDKILKVDDVYTSDISVEEAVKLIRGEKGTKVKLTIYRQGWEESKEFEIVRGVIKIPNVKLEIKESEIAYIRIYQFSSTLSFDFSNLSQDVVNSSAKKILLDLRSNPGGLLSEAQQIAGWFLERGDIVTIESFGEGRQAKEYLAKGNSLFLKYPVVILINEGTASGAEILAAALRENRNDVKLIGEKSFGKGSVQEPIDLRGGSLLKVTVAHWLTPNGKLIEELGLSPDIEVKMTEEDYQAERDPQLEKAVEILKEM